MCRSTVLRSLYNSASCETGRPPLDPFFRLAAWSAFSGITALIFRFRRWARLAREEAGGVRLVAGHHAGPGARAPDRPAHPHPGQHCGKLRAVGGLPGVTTNDNGWRPGGGSSVRR